MSWWSTPSRAALFSLLLAAALTSRASLQAPGSALQFDGVNDYVTFGAPSTLRLTTFTLEAWFRRDGAGVATGTGGVTAVPLLTRGRNEGESSTLDLNFFLGIDATRRVLVADFEDTTNGGNHPVVGSTVICDGLWHHAAATYDGNTWRLYLDGVEDAALTVGAFQPRFDSIQRAALASALTSTGSAAGFFRGAIDEARIWSVARSGSAIQSAMNAPLPSAPGLVARWALDEATGTAVSDSSGSTATGTTRNGPIWVAGSPFAPTPQVAGNGAVDLGGASDYISLGQAPSLGASTFTIEAWFRRDGAGVTTSTGSGGLVAVPLVTKGRGEADGNNRDMNYFLGIDGSGRLAADFEEGSSSPSPGLNHPVTGTTVLSNDTWYHAAATYDGTSWRLYLNGSLETTLVVGRPPRSDSIQHAAIGSALNSTGAASGYFNGAIDEVRIWTYARDAQQIASSMSQDVPASPGLVGRWAFNALCGAATNSAGSGLSGTLLGSTWQWTAGAPVSATPNGTPTANAGPDLVVTLPSTATLAGFVADDGLPGPTTSAWTLVSGPGGVSFGDPSAPATTAAFQVAGNYVLRLTANDGALAASDEVDVRVNPAAPINQPPVVDAGADRTVVLPASLTLVGSATDDGLPGGDVSTSWNIVSGPGAVTWSDANALTTTALFSVTGTYVLALTASDGVLSASDTVGVVVTATASNTAVQFSAAGSYVTFGAAQALGAATFTIETWFRRLGTGTTSSTGSGGATAVPLVSKGRGEADGNNRDMNYFLGIDTAGRLVADFEEGAGAPSPGLNHPVVGSTVLGMNTWYHAAATYDGATWRLYVNGSLDGQLAVGRPPRADSIQHAGIGTAMTSTGATAGFFDGAIDEVRIWSVARSAQQIGEGMNAEIQSAAGLLGRWGMNDTSGTSVANSATAVTGTLVGTNWSRVAGAPFTANRPPDVPLLTGPADNSTGVATAPALTVSVADADTGGMTVTFFGRPLTTAAPDFTLVALPDTQHYVDSANYPLFTAQTQWIVANRQALNIAFVTHLGDLAQNIDQVPLEWQRVDTSMSVLDAAAVPYSVSPGNHDISASGVGAFFDQYFPVSRFLGRPWYAGWLGQEAGDVNRENKNNYELFSVGPLDFVIIHLEMDIPTYSLAWADKILRRYPNRRAIISTHIYLDASGTRRTSAQFRSNGTSAEQVWQQLIRPNCNVFLVVNGHYSGESRRTDANDCGQPVHQVVQDFQDRVNGGDGWLRYFTFRPSQNTIDTYTYSPTRNGGLGEFENDASSRFTLGYAMSGTAFTTLGTLPNVTSGSPAALTWPGLAPNTRYEWYVTVSDGTTTVTSPTWTFTTQ
jgi:hypothetical protein